jgi:DNA-binding transcriptional ArsR family regulator
MFRLKFDAADLAGARYTISPLHELLGSLLSVYFPVGGQPYRLWGRQVRADPSIDHELLASLVSPRLWVPDFLAPPPLTGRPDIAGQLAQVRATAPERVMADVLAAYGLAPLPPCLRELADDPAALRDRAADALDRYWDLALAPHWPRVRALLEADLLHRGQQLVHGGPGTAFGGLHRLIHWHDSALTVDVIREWRREVPVAGRGLRLVPSLFTPWPQLPIDVGDPPVVTYPARGTAALWGGQAPAPPAVTGALLGQARARLLAMLGDPASTTELAARLGVTPSAVSQHLHVLAAAGLVTRARAGRAVLYQRTETGTQLTAAH